MIPIPCITMYVRYATDKGCKYRVAAERNQIPLERVRVFLKHNRVYAKDCEAAVTKKGKIDDIQLDIMLEGDLTEEQRNKLLKAANHCPVHKTLTTETRVTVNAVSQ
eukprot:TRINITY_DN12085_c3_g3_i2.p3 TRINITY_DN12085_c3_g3~~TRINITY_DN12085_c3_g3_i2.p3  ORF type:complete len:107 (+),score=23.37 TRINITY_DN12085_c3_g3_i2:353-673(+)